MSGLPTAWAVASIGQIAAVTAGQSPPGTSLNDVGAGQPFFQGKADFGDLYPTVRKWTTEPSRTAATNDVLISVRAPVGPTNLAPGDCAIGRGLMAIRSDSELAERYVLWAIRESADRLRSRATGSTFEAVTGPVVRSHQIAIAPRPEQQRIVTAIEEAFSKLDAGEAGLRTVRQRLMRMRDAVLAAAVTGRLVPQDPTETPPAKLLAEIGIEDRHEPRLSPSPIGWASAVLGDLVESGRRIAYGVLQPGEDVAGGVPLVRVMDLVEGAVAVRQLKRISPAIAAKFPRTTLAGGEVLLSVVGTIGRVAVAPDHLRSANVARAVAVLPLRSDVVMPEWIAHALRHEPWRRALEHAAHEVARKTLNLEDVRRFPVPIPPIAEQARIVAEVDRQMSFVEACRRTLDAGLARSIGLRRSVLKAAFEGRLVPQDPSDEPASALLDRIRTDRVASVGSNGRRRKVKAS